LRWYYVGMDDIKLTLRLSEDLHKRINLAKAKIKNFNGKPISFNDWFLAAFEEKLKNDRTKKS